MVVNSLTALSPLDGRYKDQLSELRPLFSEFGLIRYRVHVEIQWFQALSDEKNIQELPPLNPQNRDLLKQIISRFSESDAARIKAIEQTIRHDVKSVEYFLKERFQKAGADLASVREWIHFACTSEDINNLAYALMLKEGRDQILLPIMTELMIGFSTLARQYQNFPMLARTHGQPASPTTLGKEMANIVHRLRRETATIASTKIFGKINGAVGNFNAHIIACPEVNWPCLSERFVTNLGLAHQPFTTQIEPHDGMAELFDAITRLNTVLLDVSRDIWGYIATRLFRQKAQRGEVGSSTMPHKVNPIDFENAEGNLGIANALLGHMARKLPVSRWQRDLSDSTVLRNTGSAFGYSLIAYQSLLRGLSKLEADPDHAAEELAENWAVLAEPIQTVMRRYGIEKSYEKLKNLSRGEPVDREKLHAFLKTTTLPDEARQQLLQLTPATYVGLAPLLTEQVLKQ